MEHKGHKEAQSSQRKMLVIIFVGGDAPSSHVINQEIKREAIIIAADSGLLVAEEAGIKPHFVIGDMDSVDAARLDAYPKESVIQHSADKDYTDTELAFSLAVEKGCEEIWIIGGGGGRIDHLFAIRSLFERKLFPRRWITKSEDIYCIDAVETQNVLKVSAENDAVVSVFPLGAGPWEAQSAGLKWPLAGLDWNRGFFGLNNVATEKEFSVTVNAGRFMIILNAKRQS